MSTNQNTKEADDVVVEEGISNEEADAPTNADDTPAAEEEEVSPALPWWKQKRVVVIGILVLFMILAVAIVLGVTATESVTGFITFSNTYLHLP